MAKNFYIAKAQARYILAHWLATTGSGHWLDADRFLAEHTTKFADQKLAQWTQEYFDQLETTKATRVSTKVTYMCERCAKHPAEFYSDEFNGEVCEQCSMELDNE